ncbi:MAG: hypothetical protein GX864_00660 [Mollicutes bacterium]|jgi:hypothetical protein|nr:hypothetical protein [Mollicutes bacterium]
MNLNYYEILNPDYYANGKEIAESYLWQFGGSMTGVKNNYYICIIVFF